VSRRTFAGEASPTLEVSIHFPVRTDWGHQITSNAHRSLHPPE
jgi:hypothetical protein